MSEETYIGDGVYASFDGWMIKLRTRREFHGEDHVIYLEPEVFQALVIYSTKVWSPHALSSPLVSPKEDKDG